MSQVEPRSPTFAAIDFETADYGRDSACAVAVVRVEGGVIVDRAFHYYIVNLVYNSINVSWYYLLKGRIVHEPKTIPSRTK